MESIADVALEAAMAIPRWLLRGKVNIVPKKWTLFHDEVDTAPRKTDSKVAKRADRV